MPIQTLSNGETYGIHRGKINANFAELDSIKIEATDVLTLGNTDPFSPSNQYEPATKGYADGLMVSWQQTYNPTSISGDVFSRANHTGSMGAQYITQDANNRFVSDAEKSTWTAKEPAIGAKLTGFNLNLGTTAGTIAEGNHNHINAYEPKNTNIQIHIVDVNNPHAVTKTQVGLGNVDNTTDLGKPISNAMVDALALKETVVNVALKRDLVNNAFTDATIGDVTNFTNIAADGTITLNGTATAWDDDNLDPTTMAGGGTAPSAISFSATAVKIASFVNAATDEVCGIREIPHRAKIGAPISFHVHWYPTTANTGVCRFGLEYFFTQSGLAPTFPAIIYVEQAGSGTAWAKQDTIFADITPPAELGCQFCFRFFRDGTHGNDTFTGDAAVATIGYHYEIDSFGSSETLVK